jgi:glutamine amidotransferase
MSEAPGPRIAIVDYHMGNLFSVKRACEHVGLEAVITSEAADIRSAAAVILPGVGAFGDAMAVLRELRLVQALQAVAASDKPLVGICLGMQLLMAESSEFGQHAGLGILPGSVVKFENPRYHDQVLKVPQVCWNRVYAPAGAAERPWQGTVLEGLPDGVFMYFVHSYICLPGPPAVEIARTTYGHIEFCSCVAYRNIFACQFHPERSGPLGLRLYANLAARLKS